MSIFVTIFKVPGGKEMEYKDGNYEGNDLLFERMKQEANNPNLEFTYVGHYDKTIIIEKLFEPKGFTTYVMFYDDSFFVKPENLSLLRERIKESASVVNVPVLVEKAYTFQLIRMAHI